MAHRAGMRNTVKSHLWFVVVTTVLGAMVGVTYTQAIYQGPIGGGLIAGGGFGAMLALFHLAAAPRLRRFGFAAATALGSLGMTLMTAICLNVSIYGFGLSDHPAYFDPHSLYLFWFESRWWLDFAFVFGFALLFNAVISLNELVGQGVLWPFLIGRYHHPVREERIFLFVDLANSTGIAERLGDLRFHALLRGLVDDISDIIHDHHGRIDRYVGDALVITWPADIGGRDGRCLRCCFAIAERIAERRAGYLDQFGVVPHYRAACHVGTVVAGEIGARKREIMFLGDTV
ncbi:MAG: adenylate/guanylate cyclase domain-containing protein, partial [Alphaproteobacteria bacterium]|nr:adenylate/guanylate cyclase domain-containing protein [Alphaproteobacteria bacterium]